MRARMLFGSVTSDSKRGLRRPAEADPRRAPRALCGLAGARRATGALRSRRCSAITSSRPTATGRRYTASTTRVESLPRAAAGCSRLRGGARWPGETLRLLSTSSSARVRCCPRTPLNGSSSVSSSRMRCTEPAISSASASCWRVRSHRPKQSGNAGVEARARLELACLRPSRRSRRCFARRDPPRSRARSRGLRAYRRRRGRSEVAPSYR